tara:strand:+ start:178 stop:405 length:228 start_codon:yes stop_codon:yes gene_type:complete
MLPFEIWKETGLSIENKEFDKKASSEKLVFSDSFYSQVPHRDKVTTYPVFPSAHRYFYQMVSYQFHLHSPCFRVT